MVRNVKSLKEAVMPIIWLNCIFCMGIWEIPLNRPRFFLSAFYVISMSIGYIYLFYKGIFIVQDMFIDELIIHYFVLAVNILVAILAIILFWYKSENIHNIIKRCNIADNTLDSLGIRKDYQRNFRNILSFTIIWIIGMILLSAMHVIWMYRDYGYLQILYTSICFCFPIMINSVVDLTFASFIRCVKLKFQNANILVNNVIICANKSDAFKIHDSRPNTPIAIINETYKNRKDRILHLIQTLRQLHLEITKIARQINYTFCLQLLLEMSVHFTIVTTTSYSLYAALSGNLRATINDEKIIALTVWGSVYAVKVILMNNLCASVSAEAYKTGEIVQSFEGSVIDDDIREEIHQFTQQIMLNSLNFTAAGFFSINNSLTGKFFATVTTYVVILIQMNTPII